MTPDDAIRRVAAAIARSGDEQAREALEFLEREFHAARQRAASITEMTQALLHNAETHPLVFSHERDPMSLFDVETGQILEVNDPWVLLYGYARAEALTMRVSDVSSEPTETHAA